MKTNLLLSAYVLSFLVLSSCASVKPYYSEGSNYMPSATSTGQQDKAEYSLFLVGGVSLEDRSLVMDAINKSERAPSAGLVLLGDVLNAEEVAQNDYAPALAAIQKLDNSHTHLYLVPGEKEWSSGNKTSHAAINELDAALKDIKKEGRLVAPRKGCGEPEVVEISDNIVLVLMDSQWALETEAREGEKLPGCELANVLGLRQSIRDILQSNTGKHIIFATNHPVYANGPTAGNYPLSSHLLPLPVLGTVITGVKSLISSPQHFGHPAYEAYRSAMMTALSGCQNCVVVSGHEKSLQYYHRDGGHYMVAGSGDEVRHARKGERSNFSYMSRGFVRADALIDGSLQLQFISVEENGNAVPVWELTIPKYDGTFTSTDDINHGVKQTLGDSVTMQASNRYEKKRFLRGNFYRAAWSEEINLPVLWIDDVHGGLTPLQLGGGNQTRSLRLKNSDGQQFVLRSIDKKVTAVLPPALRGTFAENIVQDGIAASHPYGALVLPRLARAAGVYYTRPTIVYVPHQEALGVYDKEIGDGIYLFEERPGGNTSAFENFGNTKETFSTLDVIELVTESHMHVIDQDATLRVRLFDLWIGDWDRHDDQVRWASFEENGMTVYRPIARDRDQVFFKNDGLLDHLASRPYFNPPLRKFDDEVDYLPGLMWAGKHFDRSFLNEVTEDDFVRIAQDMQNALTDNVIDGAFRDWPAAIDRLDGKEIREYLRIRRSDLVEYAKEFYRHLSKEVTVPASDDHDRITIDAPDDDHLVVTVHRFSPDRKSHPFYQRTLDDQHTKELRVFGLGKSDTIHVTGTGNPGIKVRLIGGGGKDVLVNNASKVKLIAYDDTDGMAISGDRVTEHLNDKPFNNTYDRTDWKINRTIHFPLPAYYTDEGFGLTYNLWSTRFGFRSNPFKSNHALALSYFFTTGAFIAQYDGLWPGALGDLDFGLNTYFTGPTFTQYYYGLGNEYVDYGEKNKYHIVKGSQIRLAPSIEKRFGFGSRIFLSPNYQFMNLEDSHDEARFVYTPEANLSPENFGRRHYAGVTAGYAYQRLDNIGFPSRGGEISLSVGGRTSLVETDISHGLLSAEGALYIPFNSTATVVIATHVQADKILGDYEFFHALTLGGPDKLRGFRRDRFAGDTRFLHATDLRFKLFHSRGAVPFSLGLYGALDYGRVWYEEDDDSADGWHTAYGGGLYVVPLGLAAFRLGYMIGEDDRQINLGGALRF